MTLAEIPGFIKALTKLKMEQQLSFILGVATGSQGNSKSIKKVIKDLEKTLDELSK